LHEHIFVDGKADILFNFGAPYQRQNLNDANGNCILSRSNLDAQCRYPIIIAQSGLIDLIGVRFRAGGLSVFTRAPLNKFTDLALDLELIFGATIRDLEARLFEALNDVEHQIALLDSFFLSRYVAPTHASHKAYTLDV